jgi:indolepyruvate ferredoxin oxidoreductase alpha subunit
MKHVGVNVAADPLLSMAYSGVNGGLVLVSADDPGLHSSQNEQDNRHYAKFAKVPMLEPADSQEAKDMVGAALTISEKYQRPVLLRTTTRINHSKSVVEPGLKIAPPKRPYERQARFDLVPAVARRLHVELEARLLELAAFSEETPLNFIEWHDRKIGVVSAGAAYQYAREVFGEQASYLKLGFTFPPPLKKIMAFAEEVGTLYVVEELEPFLEEQIRAAGIKCVGKEKIPRCGELAPAIVAEALLGRKPEMVQVGAEAAPRPPILCAGCPHRGFFNQLGKLRDVVLTSDLGCYALGGSPSQGAKDSCICMGAAFSMAHGAQKVFSRFGENKRVVANLGDSTFFHSGLTGLMQAVYNNSPVVFCILDNRTTGMTGHQENPGSGFTLRGEPAFILEIEPLVRALGVRHVRTVNPLDQEAMKEALHWGLSITDAPSVVITRWPCALKRQSEADRREFGDYFHLCRVEAELCVGCRSCVRTGCPALRFSPADQKTRIEPGQCVGCEICLQVCPKKAISAVDGHKGAEA